MTIFAPATFDFPFQSLTVFSSFFLLFSSRFHFIPDCHFSVLGHLVQLIRVFREFLIELQIWHVMGNAIDYGTCASQVGKFASIPGID